MLEIFVALLYSFVFVIVYVLCFEKKDKNAHSYMYTECQKKLITF